jgi:hypothetical protein
LQQNCAPTFEWCVIKVDMPKSNIAIIWTPTFGWYVFRCEFENKHKKDMCLKKIGLCVQNMLTILGLVINMIGPIR